MCYGTELTSLAILRWTQERPVEWHYIAPGKPQQNGYVESFNGRLRDECCGSAWKKDPGSGVIGVEKGPLIPVV